MKKEIEKICENCKYWVNKPNTKQWFKKYNSFIEYFFNEYLWHDIIKNNANWEEEKLNEKISIWKPNDKWFKSLTKKNIKESLSQAKKQILKYGMMKINFKKCNIKKIEAYDNGEWWDTKRAYYDSDIDNRDGGYGHGEEFVTGKDFCCIHWEKNDNK